MNIGLFGRNDGSNGPSKVYINLLKGLRLLGHNIKEGQYDEFNGSLIMGNHPPNTLMGPNVMVLPTDNINFWKQYTNFVVPSKWVYDLYRSFDITNNTNIRIWSVGIDTDLFKSDDNIKINDCFVYFKNRNQTELNEVTSFLNNNNIKYEIITYGSYNENYLIDLCKKSKFCILLDNTESQGIAYMEILSANIPIYVIDLKIWNNRFPATSVPYFDENCGIIDTTLNDSSFDIFYKKLNSYNPRKYIIENHTLEISAQKYVNILENINR